MMLARPLLVVSAFALVLAACAPAPKSPPPSAPSKPSTMAPAPATSQPGVVLLAPDGTAWVKEGTPDQRTQAEIDDCYRYARAQIDHDVRVESDSQAAFESFPSGLGWTELQNRQRRFEQDNRRAVLFSNCMVARGYVRR